MNLWSHHFSQNTNKILSGFLPCLGRSEILIMFCSYFGRNVDFINSFWKKLTCRIATKIGLIFLICLFSKKSLLVRGKIGVYPFWASIFSCILRFFWGIFLGKKKLNNPPAISRYVSTKFKTYNATYIFHILFHEVFRNFRLVH